MGLRSTLSFSGSRFTVAIPWGAVFAITSHRSQEFWMFPDDMPPELTSSMAGARPERVTTLVPRMVALRGVPVETARADDGTSEGAQPRGRGHLRVVK